MSQRIMMIVGTVASVIVLVVLAVLVGVLYARPATAAPAPGVPGMRQVTVVGHGEVKGTPDTVTVQIGVETEAPTVNDALAQNNTQAQAIINKLKELGIAEKDIQTTNFNVSPTYDNDGRKVTGYRVSNMVQVTIHDLSKAGSLLDQVVQVGANRIYGISFSVAEPKGLQEQARADAMKDARARAETLAKAGNATVGQVLVITENIGSQPPVPQAMLAADARSAGAVPVQAGEQSFSVEVQVTYELQ